MRTRAGLSLVELMVAVAVIGILVALALPRYHAFLAQARRGEAKSNLAHLASLQAVYKIEHFRYYSGSALLAPDGGIGYKNEDGTRGDCGDYADDRDLGLNNHLGFRPQACGQLRYFYQLRPGNEAVAFAYADDEGRYIYPDCHGGGREECDYTRGDAVRMALRDAKPTVCRNITKYCPAGMGAPPPPPPPTPTPPPDPTPTPPPPTCNPATQCCPEGEYGNPKTTCDKAGLNSDWSFDVTAHHNDCCACNRTCTPPAVLDGTTCTCTTPPPCTTCAKVGGWETDISKPDCCICKKSKDDCAAGYTWIPSHCQCGCAPQSCTGNYTWNSTTCQCQCLYATAAEAGITCPSATPTWNSTTCQCECPLTATDCPHGVDSANCTCSPKDEGQECRQRNMSNYCCSEEGTGGVIPSGDNCDDAYTISWNTDLDPDACDCSAIETEEPEGCKEDNHNTHYCCSDEGVLQDDPCINPTSDYTVIWMEGKCVCKKKSETEQPTEPITETEECSGGQAVQVEECENACLDGTTGGSCQDQKRATYGSGCNCNSSDGTTYVNRVYNSSNCTCQCPDSTGNEKNACGNVSEATWNDNRCKCTCSDPKKVWNFSARTSFSLLNKALSVFGVGSTGKCVCSDDAEKTACTKASGTWNSGGCTCSGASMSWSFDTDKCTGSCKYSGSLPPTETPPDPVCDSVSYTGSYTTAPSVKTVYGVESHCEGLGGHFASTGDSPSIACTCVGQCISYRNSDDSPTPSLQLPITVDAATHGCEGGGDGHTLEKNQVNNRPLSFNCICIVKPTPTPTTQPPKEGEPCVPSCPEGYAPFLWSPGKGTCDCYAPVTAMDACTNYSHLKLGEVQNILKYGTPSGSTGRIPVDCQTYADVVNDDPNSLFAGGIIEGDQYQGALSQKLWWDYFYAGTTSKSSMSIECRKFIDRRLLDNDPEHPVPSLLDESTPYLFEALDRCAFGGCAAASVTTLQDNEVCP